MVIVVPSSTELVSPADEAGAPLWQAVRSSAAVSAANAPASPRDLGRMGRFIVSPGKGAGSGWSRRGAACEGQREETRKPVAEQARAAGERCQDVVAVRGLQVLWSPIPTRWDEGRVRPCRPG